MDYRGNSVAKFSGGFADPLLKFRWIIRRHRERVREGEGAASEKTRRQNEKTRGGRLRTYYT